VRVAYQLRGRHIKVGSFTNALQALLDKASPTERWRVYAESLDVSLDEWVRRVDRVVLLRATLERPNPNYEDRERIKNIIEGTRASVMQLVLRAGRDELQGIDMSDALVREAIDHAGRNYGTVTAIGERGGEKALWSSRDQAAAEVRAAPVDPETRDVSSNALRHELGDPSAEVEIVHEAWEARDALEDMGRELDAAFGGEDDEAAA
jgi:hypothetical protein